MAYKCYVYTRGSTEMKKNNRRKKIIIFLASSVGILAIGLTIYHYRPFSANKSQGSLTATSANPQSPENTINYSAPTDQEKQDAQAQKDALLKSLDSPSQPSPSITVSISRATQSSATSPLEIRTVINGTSTGTCVMDLSGPTGQTVHKEFGVTLQGTYSNCGISDIASSEFPVAGQWSLSVYATTSTGRSAAATQTVTIAK
jgi:hypothetical protein